MSGGGGGGDAFAEEPEAHENHERYLLTYADMITLLMALFIILFAIGQTDVAKFKRFQTGLQKQFGAPALDGGTGIASSSQFDKPITQAAALAHANPGLQDPQELQSGAPVPKADQPKVQVTANNADQTANTISQVLAQQGLPASSYEVDVDSRGVVIRLSTDEVTFASGSSVLRPESFHALDVVARSLQHVSNGIIVEGHTDNRGLSGATTNWELSALRASNVLRYFIDKFQIEPKRLQVAGYADTRPIATNDTDAGRARNRRVEIVIALHTDSVEPASNVNAVDPALKDPAKPDAIDPGLVTHPTVKATGATGAIGATGSSGSTGATSASGGSGTTGATGAKATTSTAKAPPSTTVVTTTTKAK